MHPEGKSMTPRQPKRPPRATQDAWMASWGPLGPQEAAQEPGWASHFASPNQQKSIKNRCQNAFKFWIPFCIDFGSIFAPKQKGISFQNRQFFESLFRC